MQHEDGDGLLSRAELEIELARLVLAVERKRPAAEPGDQPPDALVQWFEHAATDLLDRVSPDLRPFCMERLQQIALSNAGLELTRLDLGTPALSFAAASQPEGTPAVG